MNINKAKLLTLCGIVFCAVSIILLIYNLAVKIDISPLVAALFLVAGNVLIVVSLAYYTEK